MLGTALDVWFSGLGRPSTKVSGIKPPSTFLSHDNLGTFNWRMAGSALLQRAMPVAYWTDLGLVPLG